MGRGDGSRSVDGTSWARTPRASESCNRNASFAATSAVSDHSTVPLGTSMELAADAHLIAEPEQRAGEDGVDVGLDGEPLEIRRAVLEARADQARAHDQLVRRRQRRRDRVGEAER